MQTTRPYLIGAAITLLFIAAFSFTRSSHQTDNNGDKKKHRIVFQITTPDTSAYRALTRQLNNVLSHWPEANIEVVAHNKGIGLLEKKKCNVPNELSALKSSGVRFVACEQTLKQQKLEKSDILPDAGFVERGIVHIVERQEQGWAYIKGGF